MYLGGKAKLARRIAEIINSEKKENSVYIEPFVGAGSVMVEVNSQEKKASDAHPGLITLWKALQRGWVPPDSVSEVLYAELKRKKDTADPLTSFAGFACSFSGKWFDTYARNKDSRNYASVARRSLLRKIEKMKKVEFSCVSYEKAHIPAGSFVYCDPPYEGVAQYRGVEAFCHETFWRWVEETAERATILVSSYCAPERFECVAEFAVKRDLRGGKPHRTKLTERLFAVPGTFK